MRIDDYLRQNGLTQSAFAAKFDPPVSQGLVSQWLKGKTRITLDQALQISRLTGGQVTPEDCAAHTAEPNEKVIPA